MKISLFSELSVICIHRKCSLDGPLFYFWPSLVMVQFVSLCNWIAFP